MYISMLVTQFSDQLLYAKPPMPDMIRKTL